MTRRSKREIAREVDDLQPDADAEEVGLVIKYTTASDSTPHPELTVHPDPETRTIATPSIIPEPFRDSILFVGSCHQDGDTGIPACDLWEELTDEQLKAEHQRRRIENAPIPEYLANRVETDV
jgi:hypothetical protein